MSTGQMGLEGREPVTILNALGLFTWAHLRGLVRCPWHDNVELQFK